MLVPLLVLAALLVPFGARRVAIPVRRDVVVIAVAIWRICFFVRGAEGRRYGW